MPDWLAGLLGILAGSLFVVAVQWTVYVKLPRARSGRHRNTDHLPTTEMRRPPT